MAHLLQAAALGIIVSVEVIEIWIASYGDIIPI
jgi:hypothetical protein